LWYLVLCQTGGDFSVGPPRSAFPISYEDAGSDVLPNALSALALGFGPLAAAPRPEGRGHSRHLGAPLRSSLHLPLLRLRMNDPDNEANALGPPARVTGRLALRTVHAPVTDGCIP
jgi:hypothetical protein